MHPDDASAPDSALSDFFAAVAEGDAGRQSYVDAAPDAMRRLAKATYGHDNSQALTVVACLASIYNGSAAQEVRLDEIRHLDWSLLRDLLAVLVGTGKTAKFEDTAIREAYREIGGDDAVEWFHWYTTGGAHRAALDRLATRVSENPKGGNATFLREFLTACSKHRSRVELAQLEYIEESLARDALLVLDGLYGRQSGALSAADVENKLRPLGI